MKYLLSILLFLNTYHIDSQTVYNSYSRNLDGTVRFENITKIDLGKYFKFYFEYRKNSDTSSTVTGYNSKHNVFFVDSLQNERLSTSVYFDLNDSNQILIKRNYSYTDGKLAKVVTIPGDYFIKNGWKSSIIDFKYTNGDILFNQQTVRIVNLSEESILNTGNLDNSFRLVVNNFVDKNSSLWTNHYDYGSAGFQEVCSQFLNKNLFVKDFYKFDDNQNVIRWKQENYQGRNFDDITDSNVISIGLKTTFQKFEYTNPIYGKSEKSVIKSPLFLYFDEKSSVSSERDLKSEIVLNYLPIPKINSIGKMYQLE